MKNILMFVALMVPALANATCLDNAAKFAGEICGKIISHGKNSVLEIDGKLNANAGGVFKRVFGEAGAEANLSHLKKEYENVLQGDLGVELKDVRMCRKKMASVALENCTERKPVSECATFFTIGALNGDTYVPDNSPNCPGKLHKGISHYNLGKPIHLCASKVISISSGDKLRHPKGSDCGTVGRRETTFVKTKQNPEPLKLFESCSDVAKALDVPSNACR